MEFALINGVRRRPIKGHRGVCQNCGGEMVAKCGRVKAWHWAHLPNYNCDPWWGTQTQWHRDWKNRFPENWQEIVHIDEETGEKHIADVKTPHGLVIEFQHSPLDYVELISRESFYKNMIWVVDGNGKGLNPGYFSVGEKAIVNFRPLVYWVKWWGRSRLLHNWYKATADVYIDFGRMGLWQFYDFREETSTGVFLPLEEEWLVNACRNGSPIPTRWVSEEDEEEFRSRMQNEGAWSEFSGDINDLF